MTNWHAVVLDFDGTVVDSDDIKFEAFKILDSAFDMQGRIVEMASNGASRSKIASIIGNSSRNSASAEEVLSVFSDFVDGVISLLPSKDGVVEFYETCVANDVKIFINTATPQHNINRIVENRIEANFATSVFGGGTVNKATRLVSILQYWNFDPQRVVVIGNGVDDQQSADECGCVFWPTGDYPGNDAALSFSEITEKLFGHNAKQIV